MARASLPPPPSSSSRAPAATARPGRPRPRPSHHNPWTDIPALLLLGAGTLLFLALISYVPDDLPASSWWAPFSRTSAPNNPALNFIGRVGAIVAGWFYFTLGAGSFLVAACGLFFGVGKLLFPGLRLARRAGWVAAFVVAGACLSELQPWFLNDWHDRYNLPWGAGGWLGSGLDRGLFLPLLGKVGAPIVLGVFYACSLILLTGLHPITQVRHASDALRGSLAAWRRHREETRLARATEGERLEMDRRRLLKEQQRLEKQLRRQGVALPSNAAEVEAEVALARAAVGAEPMVGTPTDDEFAHLPPPKITDNSTAPPPAATPAKKPSLAEVLGGLRAGGGGKNAAASSPAAAPGGENDGADIRFANYELPDTELLDSREAQEGHTLNTKELEMIQGKIIETLDQFGIKVSPGDITKGPTITRYEVYPAKGVRVDRIVALEKDIARATRAERINILAPIPGKDTVGIEIANNKKVKVTLRELLESADWMESKAKIPVALGKDVYGKTIIADLAAMPHCLIAGATGSGKSVCINTIIASLLYRFTPEELRLVMVDPKVVELQIYNELPHLVVPVVTDAKKVLLALRWVIDEMMKRYELFAKTGVRNITGFNARPKPKTQAELDAEAGTKASGGGPLKSQASSDLKFAPPASIPAPPLPAATAMTDTEGFKIEARFGDDPESPDDAPPRAVAPKLPAARNERETERVPDVLPYIVVIVDELADLMQTAPADVESAIARITQMARAAGIHMIIATQTPRADVITGVIKANVPSRIAFQVASALDSRVILDENGAERLLGQGDMLYRPPGTSRLVRAQGVFVTDEEVHRLVQYTASQGAPTFEPAIHEQLQNSGASEEDVTDEDEELVQKCIEVMRQEKKASTSMLQRRLRLGYTRAARIVDILEVRGIVGPENGARGREILVDLDGAL